MKKLIIVFAILFASLLTYGQYVYKANDSEPFGYPVPANVYVFNLELEKWCLIEVGQSAVDNISGAINADEAHYIETGGGTPVASGSNYVNFTGQTTASASINADSLDLAFTRTNHVFVKSGTYSMGTTSIPEGKTILFENGAMFDVIGTLTVEGEIQAGMNQIFTLTSDIIGKNAKIEYAYAEWFGAKADSATACSDAINKTLTTFFKAGLYAEGYYFIDKTILMREQDLPDGSYPYYGKNVYSLLMGSGSNLWVDMVASDDNVFYITAQPVKVTGGVIYCPVGYTGWVFNIRPKPTNSSADWRFRIGSTFRDIQIRGLNSNDNLRGLTFDGIKIKCDALGDYSYFNNFDNVYIRRSDTAISLEGLSSGAMNNGNKFIGLVVDYSVMGIHMNEFSASNTFSSFQYQKSNSSTYAGAAFTIASNYNTFEGYAWDYSPLPTDTMIRMRGAAGSNNFVLGKYEISKHVDDQSSNRRNSFNGIEYGNFELSNAPDFGAKFNVIDDDQPTLYFQINTSNTMRFAQVSGLNTLYPDNDLGVSLGRSTSYRWKDLFTANLTDDGSAVTVGNKVSGTGTTLTLLPLTADPSSLPADGSMWMSTGDNSFNYVIGGQIYKVTGTVKP